MYPVQGMATPWSMTLAAPDLQVLGVRLGVALRWREHAPDAASAAARDGASAEALADVGAREVAGPLEAQAMLCAEGACGDPPPALSPHPPAACAGPVPGACTSAPPEAAAPGGGEAEPPAPGAGADAAAAGQAAQEATGPPWALYAVLGPARAHLSGAEVAAAAAVAGGASAEASRRLVAALPPRAWPAESPGARRALKERGDAGGAGACEQAWLAEVAIKTSTLTLAFAPGGAAAAAASMPPPPGLSCSPTAAACLGCRGSAFLLVACEALTVAAAAARTPGHPDDGAAALAASLAQPGLWVGPGRTGAAAAAADLGMCSLPPLDVGGTPDQRASLVAACAAPAPEPRAAPPSEPARPTAGGVRSEGLAPIRTASGRDSAHAQPRCESLGWDMSAAPRLLAGGARALTQGPCAPALLGSPVCLLLEAASSEGEGHGGAGASAARLSLSVGSVSGLLDAAHLRALVRALPRLCPDAHRRACEYSARGAHLAQAQRRLGLAERLTTERGCSGCRLHRPQRTRLLKAQAVSGMVRGAVKLCFTVTEFGTSCAPHTLRRGAPYGWPVSGAWRLAPQATLATAAGAGPALPPLPAFPPAALPQPAALRIAVSVASLSGQVAPGGRPGPGPAPGAAAPPATEREAGQAPGLCLEPGGVAVWALATALECELRSAWARPRRTCARPRPCAQTRRRGTRAPARALA